MLKVLNEIPVRVGSTGKTLSSSHIAPAVSELLLELPEAEYLALAAWLATKTNSIVLRADDNVKDQIIVARQDGSLRFHSHLFESIAKVSGQEAAVKKIRDLTKAALQNLVGLPALQGSERSALYSQIESQVKEQREAREAQFAKQQQLDPFALIEQLTKRVEKLEAKR